MAVTDPVPRRRDIWRRTAERDGYDYWPTAILPRFGESTNLDGGRRSPVGGRLRPMQPPPSAIRRPRSLLQLDARAGLLELALELVGLVALEALLDRLRR